jgi:hypothetical protein
MRLAALALGVALAAAACSSSGAGGGGGGGGGGRDGGPAAPTTTTVPVAVPAVDPACPTFHGSTDSLASSGTRPPALLVDATAGTAGCLDRVTFEFESLGDGLPPGYRVGYRDLAAEPLLDEDGSKLTFPATAILVVTIAPAASVDVRVPDEPRPQTYRGSLRLAYGETHHLEIVQKVPDGLGTVEWVIGLDSVRPFVVDSAMSPPRVSVYIG